MQRSEAIPQVPSQPAALRLDVGKDANGSGERDRSDRVLDRRTFSLPRGDGLIFFHAGTTGR